MSASENLAPGSPIGHYGNARRCGNAVRRTLFLVASIVVAWVLAVAGPLSLALLPVYAVVLYCLIARRRFVDVFVFVALSPLMVAFAWGAVDYAFGLAHLRGMGLPGTESHNLDRELRCPRCTGGCLVTGHEWVWIKPYNLAIRAMTACFGYVRDAYTGPYPTKAEATAALEDATEIPLADLRAGRINIAGRAVVLDEGVGPALADIEDSYLTKSRPILAAIWQDDCLILRIPAISWDDPDVASAAIALIAVDAGRPFAFYAEGEYFHHFPPVAWRRDD